MLRLLQTRCELPGGTMFSPSTLAALLFVLVPLDAYPSSDFARQYLFGQGYGCEDCETINRQIRAGGMFDTMSVGGPFGLAKRLEPLRIANRDDSLSKRRGAALDSLVAGGMFGKAKRNNEYQISSKAKSFDQFQRNVRPLNTMELGSSFGRAIKRFGLDTLGNNAFGVDKRRGDGSSEDEIKAFLSKSSGAEKTLKPSADISRVPFYLKFVPSLASSFEPKYDQLLQ